MIARLLGTIAEINPQLITVMVQGVGYAMGVIDERYMLCRAPLIYISTLIGIKKMAHNSMDFKRHLNVSLFANFELLRMWP